MTTYSRQPEHRPALDIALAYLNVGGFQLLGDHVLHSSITPIRVLDSIRRDPLLVEAAERLVDWPQDHDVEVRRLTRAFLHGKAFLVNDFAPAVVAGSSNFTYAGLARNRELNLGTYQPNAVNLTKAWFDEQWDEAEPYDLAALYASRFEAHAPYDVCMLHELYGDTLGRDSQVPNELGLTVFQRDGVWRAKRILDKRGGVVIADEVGLGKTFLAGELIREAAIERRQKVLLVTPATLHESTWLPFLQEHTIAADVISYDKLVREIEIAGTHGSDLQSLDSYAMIVVDEAHNLRNAATLRADTMRRLVGGGVPKQIVLLTATPVNNSLLDLKTLISYITTADAAFADIDVPSLNEYFGNAMAMDPDEPSGRHLFDVLDAIAVRRTRRFIKTHYPNERVGGELITFPRPSPNESTTT